MRKIYFKNGQEIINIKGGLTLRALEDNIIENATYKVNVKFLEAYAVRLGVKYGIISEEEAEEIPYSWSGNGTPGIDALSRALGLEENSLRNSGWGFCYLGEEECDSERKAERYLQVARFIGFVAALESKNEKGKLKYPALAAIQRSARSGRGHNSPATGRFVYEYDAVRYKMNGGEKSPGALERKIWAVKEAAQRKHGVRISFEIALDALGVVGLNAVSKAATVAYALYLVEERNGCDLSYSRWFKSYREARAFVIEYLQASKINPQTLEGVETHLIKKIAQKGSISCWRAMWKDRGAIKIKWVFIHPVEGTWHQGYDKIPDWRGAIHTFMERKAARLSQIELEKAVSPDSGILVSVADSYAAGNCEVGTEMWMDRMGFKGKKLLPLWKVYKAAVESNESLAMNVVKRVVAEVA